MHFCKLGVFPIVKTCASLPSVSTSLLRFLACSLALLGHMAAASTTYILAVRRLKYSAKALGGYLYVRIGCSVVAEKELFGHVVETMNTRLAIPEIS